MRLGFNYHQGRLSCSTGDFAGTQVGIPVSEIAIGKCYLTALGQVRRVLKVGNGKVL